VRILTNSLASSEANVVHAGYAKRRHDLLRAGVRLYELKPTAGREAHGEKSGIGSSSSSALHAKTFAVDRSRIFVGSFNFDLRSALLNTELGLVIDSPALARRLAELFDTTVATAAYEVRLKPDDGSLEWIERTASGETRHDTEPGAGGSGASPSRSCHASDRLDALVRLSPRTLRPPCTGTRCRPTSRQP